MAVAGKRLFWTSIIIVELVLVYLLWKPYRDRVKPVHRAAVAPAGVVLAPDHKAPAPIFFPPRRPWGGVHPPPSAVPRNPPVVNAALKSPDPVTAKVVPQPLPLVAPVDSFWCRISANVETKCDCKG